MSDQFGDRIEIRKDKAIKSPSLLELRALYIGISRDGNAVQVVETVHDGRTSSIDRCMKRRKDHIEQGLIAHVRGVVFLSCFSETIACKMLCTGRNAVPFRKISTLEALYPSFGHSGSQERIFARTLHDPPPTRIGSDVHHGAKSQREAF